MFKEISKDLGVKITTFDIPYERIKQNIRLDLNNCKSKSTILEHITEGKNKPPKKNTFVFDCAISLAKSAKNNANLFFILLSPAK